MRIFIVTILFTILNVFGFAQDMMNPKMSLQLNMRKLWSEHVIWTRQYIVSSVSNLPDAKDAAERLLKNQENIGNSLTNYYGKDAANALTALLKDHIMIAAQLVKAAIENSDMDLKKANMKWHENADKIATFLSNANPNLAKKDLQNMLYKHLDLTSQEVMNRINKKWKEDIKSFDLIFDQALMMADTLAIGIEKQFPKK